MALCSGDGASLVEAQLSSQPSSDGPKKNGPNWRQADKEEEEDWRLAGRRPSCCYACYANALPSAIASSPAIIPHPIPKDKAAGGRPPSNTNQTNNHTFPRRRPRPPQKQKQKLKPPSGPAASRILRLPHFLSPEASFRSFICLLDHCFN